jgi:hypothetical protein
MSMAEDQIRSSLPTEVSAVSVYHAAIPEAGEDAEPLALGLPGGAVLFGVFDGMGGSGGTRYVVDGVERKGAYLASRLVRDVCSSVASSFFRASPPPAAVGARGEAMAGLKAQLEASLEDRLKLEAEALGGSGTELRSSLVRTLPTTAALGLLWPIDRREPLLSTFWAGDSRVYILHPVEGLIQVTADDIRSGGDALENLIADSQLTNCISASTDFRVNAHWCQPASQSIVFAATDGCFGYVPSPAHFEHLLLECLARARSTDEWGRLLEERFADVAQDDASLVALLVGFADFASAQRAYAARLAIIDERFIKPYSLFGNAVRDADVEIERLDHRRRALIEQRDRVRDELWASYKREYEKFLPGRETVR